MYVFKAFVIDAKTETLLREATVVGRDETDAATALALNEAELALRKKDYLEILWQEIGAFESRRAKPIRIEKDE